MLSRFLEDVRTVVPDDSRQHELLPDGRTMLVARMFEPGRGDIYVVGPRTKALFKRAHGTARALILKFKPGWSIPLFGVPASALTNKFVPLEDVWGATARDVVDFADPSTMLERLTAAIERRTRSADEPGSARLARRAVHLLEEADSRIDSVASQLGITARHLRRAFTESVGVGPKEFARAARLQRAVKMTATSTDWSQIATAAGYYDQAHLIADFRELVGLTPRAFVLRNAS